MPEPPTPFLPSTAVADATLLRLPSSSLSCLSCYARLKAEEEKEAKEAAEAEKAAIAAARSERKPLPRFAVPEPRGPVDQRSCCSPGFGLRRLRIALPQWPHFPGGVVLKQEQSDHYTEQ